MKLIYNRETKQFSIVTDRSYSSRLPNGYTINALPPDGSRSAVYDPSGKRIAVGKDRDKLIEKAIKHSQSNLSDKSKENKSNWNIEILSNNTQYGGTKLVRVDKYNNMTRIEAVNKSKSNLNNGEFLGRVYER